MYTYTLDVSQDDPSASSSSSKKRRRKQRKRYPSSHHKLSGMRAMAVNKAIDFSIALNNWCVTFKDEQDVTVDLVTRCILVVWLHYISEMVRLRHCSKHAYVSIKPRLRHFSKHAYVTSQSTSTSASNHAYVTSQSTPTSLLKARLRHF